MNARVRSDTRFAIHGVHVTVHADDARLLDVARKTLGMFAVAPDEQDEHPADWHPQSVCVELSRAAPPVSLPPNADVWLDCGWIRGLADETHAYLEYDGRLVARLALTADRLEAWAPDDIIADEWTVGHRVLLPLLLEALSERGLFNVHCAALAYAGRVALFPAESGSGKTTLSLALLRGGFRLLSDDSPFLRSMEAGIDVCAFPERVNVMANTCAFFPELAPYWHAGDVAGERAKVPVDVTRIYGDCLASHGEPGAVIFTAIGECERTVIEPLSPLDALHRLILLAGPSATRAASHAKFTLLADLVAGTPCYQMRTGRDFDAIPARIAELLQATPAGAPSLAVP